MRDKLADTFNQLWDEQEKKNLLARALAHDLRTPLSIVKGHNDLVAIELRKPNPDMEKMEASIAAEKMPFAGLSNILTVSAICKLLVNRNWSQIPLI